MDERKFGNILTFALIVLIVIIFGILGYFGYAAYTKSKTQANTDTALQDFQQTINNNIEKPQDTTPVEPEPEPEDTTMNNPLDKLNSAENNSNSSSQPAQTNKTYMENFEIVGSIKIPKTNLELPVLEKVTKRSLELSVAKFEGPGLNQVGNTVIMGHNYRNGLFFSDNKKLSNGDKIYVTDKYGEKVTYEIYNIYQTTSNDATYFTRDTEGRREISLQTCTDDGNGRIVIWAVEKQ